MNTKNGDIRNEDLTRFEQSNDYGPYFRSLVFNTILDRSYTEKQKWNCISNDMGGGGPAFDQFKSAYPDIFKNVIKDTRFDFIENE